MKCVCFNSSFLDSFFSPSLFQNDPETLLRCLTMCAELLKQMNIKTRIGPTISALMSSLVHNNHIFQYFSLLSNYITSNYINHQVQNKSATIVLFIIYFSLLVDHGIVSSLSFTDSSKMSVCFCCSMSTLIKHCFSARFCPVSLMLILGSVTWRWCVWEHALCTAKNWLKPTWSCCYR